MKRILTSFIFLLLAAASFAYDAKIDGIYYNFSGTEATVTYYSYSSSSNKNAYTGSVVIPETVTYNGTTYTVTKIGERAFYGCSGLTSVTIPNSVTSIGDYAFYDCNGLTSVTIPNSVTSIGSSAFSGCSNLTSIEINSNAILSKSYTSSYSVKNIFGTQVQNYIIGNDVMGIGSYAFNGCTGLSSITIPSSVTTIGESAFKSCSGLTSVTIGNGVTNLQHDAFSGCSNLTSVEINNNKLLSKGYSISSSLKYIFGIQVRRYVVGNDVTSIGDYAFYDCNRLMFVKIPESVTSIGKQAFDGCSGLTSITIPNSVTSIGERAFYGCSFLTHVTIGNSVTSIGESAFRDCYRLTSVTIGNSVTSIGNYAFSGCSGLKKVIVDDIAAWCIISFSSYDANPLYYAHHIYSDANTEIMDLVIPNSVTSIGEYAFAGCSGLTSVTIPNSVTSIGDYAFEGCSNLTVSLPDGVTSIGRNAFFDVKKVLVNRGTTSLLALWNRYYTPQQIGTEASLPAPKLTATARTQSTISYRVDNWYDDYKFYYYTYSGLNNLSSTTFVQEKLQPNSSGSSVYVCMPGADFDYYETLYYTFSSDAKTLEFNPSIAQTGKTASSFSLKGMYSQGDAVVTKQVISVDGKSVEGNEVTITGLSPNSSYSTKYIVTITYGNGETCDYTKTKYFETDPLTLTTEQPKVVSMGNVIVSAKANVDDEETNVGFEWRRTDWTDDFASNTGTANMYEGTMEGYIRNLNTEKLWKFRPYYLADNGTYYYGDWVGLDPTNTSYFEPTVHTYAKIDVTGNTALVKGYALGGTDNITVQGFKYWKTANLARAEFGDRTEVTAITIPANAETIEAEGRVMEATLSGLDYESTYYYVAFAKTAEGTYYGDVKTFTTGSNPTGIEAIENSQLTDEKAISHRVKGIYTLSGVKVSDDAADLKTLPRGIYIVNGKKIAIK